MARTARPTAKVAERRAEKERPFRIDPEDENYIKDLQRPAAIKEDLNEMDRRKRVQEILQSKSFCKELESVIRQESECVRNDGEQLRTLQKLSELTLSNNGTPSLHKLGGSPIPVADGNGKYAKEEIVLRNKMASLFRLVDLFHWSQGIYNHITVRIPGRENEVLVNPFGLLYHEISASSLIRTDVDGEILDNGSTNLGVNQAAFLVHSAILRARPEVECVVHMHSAIVTAVSSLKCGLLPICQEAMAIGPVAYHEYQESGDDEEEKAAIVRDLGDKNVLLLRNNGIVTVGRTVEEAILYAHHAVAVCETQIRAAKAGLENLFIPNENAIRRAHEAARSKVSSPRRVAGELNGNTLTLEWGVGELEWEAFMRVLDNAGFRTGHIYKQPQLKQKPTVAKTLSHTSDVAAPPAACSVGAVDESDAEAVRAHRMALLRKEQEKIRWLNSPNAYQKVEILESGTDQPKVITKWVQDPYAVSQNGTPVKIASPHQFSPFSNNPKEFKEKQRAIKENRRLGQTTAGPQSQVLDGVTYEDLNIIRCEGDNTDIGTADRVVTIGTASKGIIDRQHQCNAQVYRQLYAPNPFASETDEGIRKYIEEVEAKSPQRTPRSKVPEIRYRSESPFRIDSPAMDAAITRSMRETTFDSSENPSTRMHTLMDECYFGEDGRLVTTV